MGHKRWMGLLGTWGSTPTVIYVLPSMGLDRVRTGSGVVWVLWVAWGRWYFEVGN